jgi:hypothetical protein
MGVKRYPEFINVRYAPTFTTDLVLPSWDVFPSVGDEVHEPKIPFTSSSSHERGTYSTPSQDEETPGKAFPDSSR